MSITLLGPHHYPRPRDTFLAKSSSDFSDVRVEAQQMRTATLRWSYAGSDPIKVYRSTDGASYSLVATLDETDVSYFDTGLTDEQIYYYKLTDDDAVSFSDAVFVVTYVSLKGRVVNNTAYMLPIVNTTGASHDALREMQEARVRSDDSENPCIICSFNQAIVVNCSTDCTAFRIILTEDINSISMVGCDLYGCPTIEFVTPPGETYGVCGWPFGWCDFVGDECFESPTAGGDVGTSSWSNGIDFPAPGGDGNGGTDPGCPCPPSAALSIKCCDACDLSCGSGDLQTQLKACGGIGPYTWSIEGPATIDPPSGDTTTVKVVRTSGSGGGSGFPGQIAFTRPYIPYQFYNTGSPCCDGGFGANATTYVVGAQAGTGYDCAGDVTGGDTIDFASTFVVPAGDCAASRTVNTPQGSNTEFNSSGGDECGPAPGSTITGTASFTNANGTWENTFLLPMLGNSSVVQVHADSFVDKRSAAMIASGTCNEPCVEDPIIITLTDGMLRSVSRIIA
jgi:hypothetical protein